MPHSSSWTHSTDVDVRVEQLLAGLTLAQKIQLLTTAPDSKFDEVPVLAQADGPSGVRRADLQNILGPSTAMPATIALAATWSEECAREYGDIVGAECAALGIHVLLGPGMDIARAPWSGRIFEAVGEDALLASRIIAAYVPELQAHRVQACLKHYVGNNQEFRRNDCDVIVDDRTLHEVYLPPFEAAIHAGAASVMGSYNRINGVFACENPHVLTTILRDRLGFRGWVVTDFMAAHGAVSGANAGLDRELGPHHWQKDLIPALEAGHVTIERIDEMVRRILRPTVGLGQVDTPLPVGPLPVEKHSAAAQRIAEAAIVLLKNDGDLLPLSAVRSITVIGSDADNVSAAGGGSGRCEPTHATPVLQALRARAGANVRVEYAQGIDPITAGTLIPGPDAVPSALLSTSTGARGLRAQYFASLNFTGDPIVEQDELLVEINRILFDSPALSTSSPKRSPVPWQTGPKFSVRWTGVIEFPADGEYTLALCALGASRLWLDNALVIDASSQSSAPTAAASGSSMPILGGASQNPQDLEIPRKPFTGARITRHTLHARAGERRTVRIEYAADHPAINFLNGAQFRFGMIAPAGVVMPLAKEAAALAATCDVAIVVARTQELEGMDRAHLRLPGGQEELIRAVCAANPRTIVVTMSGGPLDVSNWNAAAPAILSAWFAGQEQGAAVARVLFGDVAPRGRLPLTFPRGERTPLLTPEQYPGVDGTIHYTEGRAVGYRGYAARGITPEYPFGHGLTYTHFEYADLQVTDSAATFTLKNVGARAGCETAQAYLTPPVETGEPIKLAGFVQVELQPGETQRVTIPFDARARSMWNAARAEWERVDGDWQVHVGASAGNVRLRA